MRKYGEANFKKEKSPTCSREKHPLLNDIYLF